MTDGRSKPALRIRRYGDNIEVLVRYDARGKVSPDSPISNIEEKDKAIGDTSAKVLGEFIGAKGFNVDSYVMFEKTFDDEDLAGVSTGADAVSQPGEKVKGSVGMAFSIKEKAVNPTVLIPIRLPPKSVGGTSQMSFNYFIPDSNKAIAGFRITAGGTQFGGKEFSTRGNWTKESASSESYSEASTVYLYFIFNPKNNKAKLHEDKIVIGSMKVEQVKFTAFIVQRLGENGVISEEFKDPASQPKFATNGELLPQ